MRARNALPLKSYIKLSLSGRCFLAQKRDTEWYIHFGTLSRNSNSQMKPGCKHRARDQREFPDVAQRKTFFSGRSNTRFRGGWGQCSRKRRKKKSKTHHTHARGQWSDATTRESKIQKVSGSRLVQFLKLLVRSANSILSGGRILSTGSTGSGF